ncbi:glycoside hydrolase family 9 protein [Flavobacterium franklandianum]|uniref:Endoglucanase n=1 Tax=Flavobacterium franklandianum TaxID=2594430 RepID=A0A553CL36_9FLAO|nr:glycoside hydrolase family 9 protein [Flavobacterium franklandianum]TRX21258.1 cellulase [Flavobacterium franklandianum]
MKTTIKKLFLFLFLLFSISSVQAQTILLNQIGYKPISEKRAFICDSDVKTFKIINTSNNEVVYNGEISSPKYWESAGKNVSITDFSSIQKSGKYTIVVGNSSKTITIDNVVYENLGTKSLEAFYLARASETISEKYAGIYARPLGHPDDKVIIHASAATDKRPEGSIISSPSGWYDAGDYNKYIVNSGITVHTLLQLYEMYPEYSKNLKLKIPENSNQVPDLLDEILVNLRWMLTMQDPNDGGVYHKLTSKNFCGMIMPQDDKLDRYVVMKSTAATLDFAAVMAKVSRVFSKYENEYPHLSNLCLIRSKNAWNWAQKNPNVLYVQPKDISTGEYGNKNIDDEKYWAAIELYLSTKNEVYLNHLPTDLKITTPTWSQVESLGAFSLISSTDKIKDGKIKDKIELIKQNLLNTADQLYKINQKSPFKISMNSFSWGSNSDLANQGLLLLHAYTISGGKKYFKAAEDCLHYILGSNPLNMCFVTSFGDNSPKHIHDRRSSADKIDAPIPGLLVGGPTTTAKSDCGEDKYKSTFPALSYADMECSYSTNEIAINWNAPLAFLVNAINAINK